MYIINNRMEKFSKNESPKIDITGSREIIS